MMNREEEISIIKALSLKIEKGLQEGYTLKQSKLDAKIISHVSDERQETEWHFYSMLSDRLKDNAEKNGVMPMAYTEYGGFPTIRILHTVTEQLTREDMKNKKEIATSVTIGELREITNGKNGRNVWVVSLTERVSDDEFKELMDRCRKLGGYYFSKKPNNGFVFSSIEKAESFNNINTDEDNERTEENIAGTVSQHDAGTAGENGNRTGEKAPDSESEERGEALNKGEAVPDKREESAGTAEGKTASAGGESSPGVPDGSGERRSGEKGYETGMDDKGDEEGHGSELRPVYDASEEGDNEIKRYIDEVKRLTATNLNILQKGYDTTVSEKEYDDGTFRTYRNSIDADTNGSKRIIIALTAKIEHGNIYPNEFYTYGVATNNPQERTNFTSLDLYENAASAARVIVGQYGTIRQAKAIVPNERIEKAKEEIRKADDSEFTGGNNVLTELSERKTQIDWAINDINEELKILLGSELAAAQEKNPNKSLLIKERIEKTAIRIAEIINGGRKCKTDVSADESGINAYISLNRLKDGQEDAVNIRFELSNDTEGKPSLDKVMSQTIFKGETSDYLLSDSRTTLLGLTETLKKQITPVLFPAVKSVKSDEKQKAVQLSLFDTIIQPEKEEDKRHDIRELNKKFLNDRTVDEGKYDKDEFEKRMSGLQVLNKDEKALNEELKNGILPAETEKSGVMFYEQEFGYMAYATGYADNDRNTIMFLVTKDHDGKKAWFKAIKDENLKARPFSPIMENEQYDLKKILEKLSVLPSTKNVTENTVTITEKEKEQNPKSSSKKETGKTIERYDKDIYRTFFPKSQRKITDRSPEFKDTIAKVVKQLEETPKIYTNEKTPLMDKTVHAHYFEGATDIMVLEADTKTGEMFSYVILNGDTNLAEAGYVTMDEINSNPMLNLDFHYHKKTLREQLEELYPDIYRHHNKKQEKIQKNYNKNLNFIKNEDIKQRADTENPLLPGGGSRSGDTNRDATPSDGEPAGTAPSCKGAGDGEPVGEREGNDGGRDSTNISENGGEEGDTSIPEDEAGTERGSDNLREETSGIPYTEYEVVETKRYEADKRNFLYTADILIPASDSSRLKANAECIEILSRLMAERRSATDDERRVLATYTGFGGLTLPYRYSSRIDETERRLIRAVEQIDPDDKMKVWSNMESSMLTAYYTDPEIAAAVNHMLTLEGFDGQGEGLDPSAGNGHFEGTMQGGLRATEMTLIEPDYVSSLIARELYPGYEVRQNKLEDTTLRNNHYDIVTSNHPFDRTKVYDKSWKEVSSPVREVAQHSLHGYFAVKSIELCRKGGLVNFITTSAIMDSPASSMIRRHIADTCEIVGAIRLPKETFKGTGTEVVTDVLFLRKFTSEAEKQSFIDNDIYRKTIMEPFLSTAETTVHSQADDEDIILKFNAYYSHHPENILGKIEAGGQYTGRELTVTDDQDLPIETRIRNAEQRIVDTRHETLGETIYTSRGKTPELKTETAALEHESIYTRGAEGLVSGNIALESGKVGVIRIETDRYGGRTAYISYNSRTEAIAPLQAAKFIRLRNALTSLIASQVSEDGDTERKRSILQSAYSDYVHEYGRLCERRSRILRYDSLSSQVFSLEKTDKGQFMKMADIFSHDTIVSHFDFRKPKTDEEALAQCLSIYGRVNARYLRENIGEDWLPRCSKRVFRMPEGGYDIAENYLSGDVVSKLEDAKRAAENDESYDANVKALEAVQPERRTFGNFPAHMGARWIPVSIYNDFLREVFDIRASRSWKEPKSAIDYFEPLNEYTINIDRDELGGAAAKWASGSKSPADIFEAALLDHDIKIYFPHGKDEKPVLDVDATKEANAKVDELKEEFETWCAGSAERTETLENEFNRRFNRIRLTEWDGRHITVPGLTGKTLYDHQKAAVWMLINNHGGIVDHMVGAGKTLAMQATIMEMRRLGIAKKPMILALKSTVEQMTESFQEAFPSARILAPLDSDFTKDNRNNFLSQIALNDYDCIILSHEQYDSLNHTREAETRVLDEQLDQVESMIMLLHNVQSPTQLTKKQIKGLERRKSRIESKIKEITSKHSDSTYYFESMGIDYLFVDECQQFKNLAYFTQYSSVAGLGPSEGSQRAFNLLTGVRHLQRMHGGDRGVVFLSGTTITNSLTEMYNILNYLRPEKMASMGLNTFDAWATTFAKRTTEAEFGVTTELRENVRFRKFEAIGVLSAMYKEIADVRSQYNLKLPRPSQETHLVTIKPSDTIERLNAEVIKMVRSHDGLFFGVVSDNKTPWSLLATNIGKKLTISPKLIDEMYDDEGGKIFHLCENVKAIYDKFSTQKGTQLIFCDGGVDSGDGKWNAYSEIIRSLSEDYGIPRAEIADIHIATTKNKRDALFKDVNDGKVRILIGGTKNMGTGVNVQQRVTAIHHVDIPWTPSDVEQRNGRGVRQGNRLAEEMNGGKVDIYYYAVEKTLDTYRYQLQDTKGKMLESFKTASSRTDTFSEDEAEGENGALDPTVMVSILSGNPVILEKKKQDDKVDSLERRKRGFLRDHAMKVKSYEMLKERLKNFENLKKDNGYDCKSVENKGFKADSEGNFPPIRANLVFDDGRQSPEYIKAGELGQAIHESLIQMKPFKVISYGQTAQIKRKQMIDGKSITYAYEMELTSLHSSIPYRCTLSNDPVAAGQAMQNLLKKVLNSKDVYDKAIADVTRQMEGAEPGEAVFPKEQELLEEKRKQREINERYENLIVKDDQSQENKDNENEKEYMISENRPTEKTTDEKIRLKYIFNKIEDILEESGIKIQYSSLPRKIKAYAQGDTITFNASSYEDLTPETQIHEYTHIWCSAMQRQSQEEWAHVKNLLRKTTYWEHVKNSNNYIQISDDEDKIASETLARISGKRGEEWMSDIDIKSNLTDNEKTSLRKRVLSALRTFWGWTSEKLFGNRPRNAEEVADMVLSDLLKGRKLITDETLATNKKYKDKIHELKQTKELHSRSVILDELQSMTDIQANDQLKDCILRDNKGHVIKVAVDDYTMESIAELSLDKDFRTTTPQPIKIYNEDSPYMNMLIRNESSRRRYTKTGDIMMDVVLKDKLREIYTKKGVGDEYMKTKCVMERKYSICYLNIQKPAETSMEEIKATGGIEKAIENAKMKGNDSLKIRTDKGYEYLPLDYRQIFNAEPIEYNEEGKETSLYERFENKVQEKEFFITGEIGAKNLDKGDYTHRLDDLRIAKQYEEIGRPMNQIKTEHWWEKGLDNKWIYEVPMNDFSSLDQKIKENTGKEGIFTDTLNIDDIPQLKNLYPEEKLEIRIEIDPAIKKTSGEYHKKTKSHEPVIIIKANDTETLKPALLHEMQHFAQDIEGMSAGVSVKKIVEHQQKICDILRINQNDRINVPLINERLIVADKASKNEIDRICALYAMDCKHLLGRSAEHLYLTNAGEATARASVFRTLSMRNATEEEFSITSINDALDIDPELVWNGKASEMSELRNFKGYNFYINPENAKWEWEHGNDDKLPKSKEQIQAENEEYENRLNEKRKALYEKMDKDVPFSDTVKLYIPLTDKEVKSYMTNGYRLPYITKNPIKTERIKATSSIPMVLQLKIRKSEAEGIVGLDSKGDYMINDLTSQNYRIASIRQSNEPEMFGYSGMFFCRQDKETQVTESANAEQTRTLVKAIEKTFPKEMRGKVRILSHKEFEMLGTNLSDYIPNAIGLTTGNGTVYIDREKARIDTPLHELGVHRLMDIARKHGIKEIEETIIMYGATAPETIKNEVERIYPDIEKSSDLYNEECAAISLGLQQQGKIQEFLKTEKEKTWYTKLTNFIFGAIDKLKDKIIGKEYADLTPLQKIEEMSHETIGNRLFSLIMGGKEIKTERTVEYTPETRAQIIGLNGIKRLVAANINKDYAVIPEGNEIKDALKKYILLESGTNAGNNKLLNLTTGMYYGPLDKKVRMETIAPKFIQKEDAKPLLDGNTLIRLDRLIEKEDPLFTAYPEFRKIEVIGKISEDISNDFSNIQKEYTELLDDNTESGMNFRICVYKNNYEKFKESVIHEIQHAIQTTEGFEEGYPFTTPLKQYELEFLKNKVATLTSTELKKMGNNPDNSYFEKHNIRKKAVPAIKQMLRMGTTKLQSELNTIENMLSAYTYNAGENEAYAIARRINLTKEDRLARPVPNDYFVNEKMQKPSPINQLLKRTKQGTTEYNLYGTMKNMLTFAELRQRISILEIAQHYGYRIIPKQGVRVPILEHDASGDKIGIFNPTNPGEQGYFTLGDDSNKGTLYNFIATRVQMGIIPNPLQSPDSENINFVVNRVAHDYLNIPLETREENRKWQKRIENKMKDTEQIKDFTAYCKPLDNKDFLQRRGISTETADSPLFKGRVLSLNNERMEKDSLLISEKNESTLAFPLWNAKGEMIGLEQRNDNLKRFLPGSKKSNGIWHSNIPATITDVVICETPLDAMAYHQLKGNDTTIYVATEGNVCMEQISGLNTILQNNKDKINVQRFTMHLANDSDKAGANFNLLYLKAQMRLKKGCIIDQLPTDQGYSQMLVSYSSQEIKNETLEKINMYIEDNKDKTVTEEGAKLLYTDEKSKTMKDSILFKYKSGDMFAISALCDTLIKNTPLPKVKIEHSITKDFNDDLMVLNYINNKEQASFSYDELRINKNLFLSDIESFLANKKPLTKSQEQAQHLNAYIKKHKNEYRNGKHI